MSTPIKLFVFSSANRTNIWAGIGARMWAVSKRDDAQMKGLLKKAEDMSIGSLGIFYCTEVQSLTTPFLVYSQPSSTELVKDVWPETDQWVLPFKIQPLGTPRRLLHKDRALEILPTLKAVGKTNISHALPISATTVFSPAPLTSEDWSLILSNLSE